MIKDLNKNPKVSIIIPVYNIAPYLERCLESVRCQTYKELQIIIIDDGSMDQTGLIADSFAKKDKRFQVIHKENRGVSAARKTGLDQAAGEYIGFVDGDDYIEPEMYEKLVKLAVEYDADIAHCGYQMVFPDRVDLYHGTNQLKLQDRYTGVKDLLEGNLVEPGLWNKIYRRKLFNQINYDENIVINEDLLLNYFLFHRSEKAVFIDIPYYHYMVRKDSASTSDWNEHKIKDPIYVLEIMSENEKDGELKKIINNRYIYQLVRFVILNTDNRQDELKRYQQNLKKKLKTVLKNTDKTEISEKNYYMGQLALRCTPALRFFHQLYGNITGTSSKYRVK